MGVWINRPRDQLSHPLRYAACRRLATEGDVRGAIAAVRIGFSVTNRTFLGPTIHMQDGSGGEQDGQCPSRFQISSDSVAWFSV